MEQKKLMLLGGIRCLLSVDAPEDERKFAE